MFYECMLMAFAMVRTRALFDDSMYSVSIMSFTKSVDLLHFFGFDDSASEFSGTCRLRECHKVWRRAQISTSDNYVRHEASVGIKNIHSY